MQAEGCVENWITCKSREYSAKELTVLPGKMVTIKDARAYGMMMGCGGPPC